MIMCVNSSQLTEEDEQKMPGESAMPNRKRIVFFSACVLIAVLICLFVIADYVRNREFRLAREWHRAHGSKFSFVGRSLTLPQDWWEKGTEDGGMPSAAKASNNLTDVGSTGITFDRKGAEEGKRSEGETRALLESFVASSQGGGGYPKTSLVVVKALSSNLYCLKTELGVEEVEMRCNAAGSPIVIKSVATPKTEKEVESILTTFE